MIELIYIIVLLALIFWGIPALIKYFIRYGIDYYLSKVKDKEDKSSE